MTTETETTSQLKRALQTLKELRARLERVERARNEPIAVIGMACRFPGGADSPKAYWELLKNRVDGIVAVPADRWDNDALFDADAEVPGKVTTRWGGFLPQVDRFDAAFFGISPREAIRMDPQQRLLLEVAWEAFEDAGLPMEKLAGSRTGVFIGVHSQSNDYYLMQALAPEELDIYSGTGTSHNVISGRISYLYDLHGPNVALDTACSSSLAALHLAVQSLRSGESNLVLAGGVNVILSPEFSIMTSRMRMMAADGRCKAFDSRADGFVRSEGSGAVVLKRLSDALKDGDPILAVIRGSAINQDGHSNGLTAPNGRAQQMVIRDALANAGVKPSEVSYIETHGTGTALGDPIEVEALGEIYGKLQPNGLPCVLGSTKTNLGHLEGAAGIAGFIKTVLMLQHHTIPANLHFKQLNPHISLAGTRLQIASDETAWETGAQHRLAGVSAFGWSGTNVHLILEEFPQTGKVEEAQPAERQPGIPTLLPISARSPEALKALAEAYRAQLAAGETALADLCYAAANKRSHHEHRLAVVGHTPQALSEALEFFIRGASHPRLSTGFAPGNKKPGVVFVFSGQGGQWLGMGRQLLAQDSLFRKTIEECETAFQPYVDWSLRAQITASKADSLMEETDVFQPCIFAIQTALAVSLRARGVVPDVVIGHSMGEVAAAYISGALSLADAARVICIRSQLMRRMSGKGAVAVVGLAFEAADALLDNYRDRLAISVINSPTSTVLSGDTEALEEVLSGLRDQNIFVRAVNMNVAAHSPQMDALRPELVAALRDIHPQTASIPLYSTVTGEPADGRSFDAAYWGKNLRQPVQFAAATTRLLADGYTVFIECGPHPVLLLAIDQAVRPEGQPATALTLLPTMRRGEDEQMILQSVMAGLYTAGLIPDWSQTLPEPGRFITLPSYPWQRKHYWIQVKQNTFDPLTSWGYQVDWKLQEKAAQPTPPALGTWLIFCEPAGQSNLGQALAEELTARGGRAVCVLSGTDYAQQASNHFVVNPHRSEQFKQLIQAVCGNQFSLQGAAYLWGMDAPTATQMDLATLQSSQSELLGGALHLVQSLAGIQWQPGGNPRLWIITRDAQPVAGRRPAGLAQATLWGLGRVVAFEHPDLWGGLIDVDQIQPEALAAELLSTPDQQTGFQLGKRYVAQLVHQPAFTPENSALAFLADASYLVTGGLGGLGIKVANWLASHGAKHIALMGRSSGSEAARQAVQALADTGVQVQWVQGDVSQPEDVRRILAEIVRMMPPLHGVIHAAGMVEDALLVRQNWAGYERVFAAKVAGAWNLHTFTQDLPLDFFVLFSSAAALLGTPGQANYAAANAFMDALAFERHAGGLPALSINWGAWNEVGLAARQADTAVLARLGIESFSPEKGLLALGRLIHQQAAQVAVVAMKWEKFTVKRPGGDTCTFFASLTRTESTDALPDTQTAEPQILLQQLEAAQPAARADLLRAHVHQIVAKVLSFDHNEALSHDQGFFQLGMDSMMAVELKNSLQKSLGRSLRTTLAFDYPSINLLTQYLYSELFPQQPSPADDAVAAPDHDEALEELTRDELKSMLDLEMRNLENDL